MIDLGAAVMRFPDFFVVEINFIKTLFALCLNYCYICKS